MRYPRKIVALATAAGALAAMGIGYAATSTSWTTVGDGSGSAKAYTQVLTLAATTPAADSSLYPGNATGSDLTFKISNTNPYNIDITGVAAASVGSITTANGKGACPAADVSFTAPTSQSTITNHAVNAAVSNQVVTLVGALKMSALAADGCQGATFSVPVTVTIVQSGS
ncbi:MAG: hypothetical protein JWO37_8 [Acidimicrobiales bacterium]|jgi:hypothetical protein|nr:hypothetical protein [Acidimicrobiales bacterium]